ncbi:hypothetical protein OBBRIDRAFT_790593 [Obba rivulosa]|uniref:Uncharacterized protein n=1 Tax=Obba rivulosa TaxID=1052685 RepID=A0A8E2AXV6_9APHY|nr:hypothetical protein OBBRIDRAFT_790593 [Obba rivulosa]
MYSTCSSRTTLLNVDIPVSPLISGDAEHRFMSTLPVNQTSISLSTLPLVPTASPNASSASLTATLQRAIACGATPPISPISIRPTEIITLLNLLQAMCHDVISEVDRVHIIIDEARALVREVQDGQKAYLECIREEEEY